MKQRFKYIFTKIIRLSNGRKINQICSYVWYFYICSKQNNLGAFWFFGFFFLNLQVFFLLISPDSQRLFFFNWYWNTTTFSTFLASGGFVPGELNTQRI